MGSSQMIVLDTHVWVWWVSNPDQLSSGARIAIDQSMADSKVFISSISAWEIAMLVARGRLELTMPVRDWIAISEGLLFLELGSGLTLRRKDTQRKAQAKS